MPSTLTQRRSGTGGSSSASKSAKSRSKETKPSRSMASTMPQSSSASQSPAMPARSSLSSIDQMTQTNETGSIIKIIIWGVVILATGIGLAVIVRNLTEQNTDESNNNETTQEEETVVEDQTEDETTTEETTTEDTTEEETTEEDTTTEDTTAEETEEEDTTDTTAAADEYSTLDKTIDEGLTGNVVGITGYGYSTSAANFVYDIKLSNAETYPKVTATLDETAKTLTVKVYNLASDAIVGNGGTGSTTFAAPRNVQSVEISNSNHVTTFVFSMNTATEYKLLKTTNDSGVSVVRLDIKNS